MELPLLTRAQAGDDDAFRLTTAASPADAVIASLCGVGLDVPLPPPPGPGEQYRFHFDMTKCIGCKCCVVACNEQNGNPADILWRRVTAGRLCDYSGMTYAALDTNGSMQWPFPEGTAFNPRASRRLYADGVFPTDDGRARLLPTHWAPFPEQPNREYPLILNTGRTVEHWHTRTKTGGISILQRMSPRAWLEMNPVDAERLELRPHDRVEVVSPRGRVSSVELRITEIVAPGQVFLPFHFVESNANQITQSAFDPISREPNYKQCSVRVERSSVNTRPRS
jgi:assimilatory nitrate reductase catalytic subunit